MMHRILVMIVALSFAHGMAAQSEIFDAGCAAAGDGRWQEAHALFERALVDGAAPRAVALQNLGACAFELDRLAEAAWHYRRALRHAPGDAWLRFDLDLVERRLGVARAPASTLVGRVRQGLGAWTARELCWLAAGLLTSALLGWLMHAPRRSWRWHLCCGVIVCVSLSLFGVAAQRTWWRVPVAVVLESAALLSAPSLGAPALEGRARPGQHVRVIAASDTWARVVHPLGEAWIECSILGFVEPRQEDALRRTR